MVQARMPGTEDEVRTFQIIANKVYSDLGVMIKIRAKLGKISRNDEVSNMELNNLLDRWQSKRVEVFSSIEELDIYYNTYKHDIFINQLHLKETISELKNFVEESKAANPSSKAQEVQMSRLTSSIKVFT